MPADRNLLEQVYAFARARATERFHRSTNEGYSGNLEGKGRYKSELRHLQWAYAEATSSGNNAAIAAAIDICRKAAMKDRDHPDYDPIWTL